MKKFNLLKKIRAFIRYHKGPKEIVYENKLNDYIPKEMFDLNYCLYIVGDKKKLKSGVEYYILIMTEYNQGYDV